MADGHFHLFTYGTLKRGADARANPLVPDCERIGSGSVRGTLFDLRDYPALLLGGGDAVSGEVWRCPARILPQLDRYEGTADGLFRRAAVEVDGVACWVYLAGPKLGARLLPEARIPSGEWTR